MKVRNWAHEERRKGGKKGMPEWRKKKEITGKRGG